MVLQTSDSKLIVGLLITILILVIGFIIAAIFLVFIPVRRIENTINQTSGDIETLIGTINNTSTNVNNLVTTVTQTTSDLRADFTTTVQNVQKTSNDVENLVNQANTYLPQIQTALCGFLPSLPFCHR